MAGISTDIETAHCRRCGAYVLSAIADGAEAAADPGPLNPDEYRAQLIAGNKCYRLVTLVDGTPWQLQDDTPSWPSQLPRLKAHGCGTGPIRKLKPAAEQPPPKGACQTWQDAGWTPPKTCPRVTSPDTPIISCRTCEPPPFDQTPQCEQCRRPIHPTTPKMAIQIGEKYVWAIHDKCPPTRNETRTP